MASKIDLEKLRQDMDARNRPSELPGLKTKDYGASYKSPYSKRGTILKQQPSAPSVMVNYPPPQQNLRQSVSPYSQTELNKTRKSILVKQQEHGKQTNQTHRDSFSPLMNAPSILASHRQKKSILGSEGTGQDPSPLIPPKPAKTENLPKLRILPETSDRQKEAAAGRGRVDFATEEPEMSGRSAPMSSRPNQVALVLNPARRRSFRDGSINVDLDQVAIATAKLPTPKPHHHRGDKDLYKDDDYDHDTIPKPSQKIEELNDSLLDIRPRKDRIVGGETVQEWKAQRIAFLFRFLFHFIATVLVIVLTSIFVFQYNYGFALPTPHEEAMLLSNPKLLSHIKQRALLNTHMFVMIVPCMQMIQYSTLLFRIFPTVRRSVIKWIHGGFNILIVGARVLGFYYCVAYHWESGTSHFNSMHSYVGVLTLIIHAVSLSTGFVFLLPCCSWETRIDMAPTHRSSGNLILLSDSTMVITGCIEMAAKFFSHDEYPDLYPYHYHELSTKTVILNALGLVVMSAAAHTMYLQVNYEFRGRRKPGTKKIKDWDLDAIDRVKRRRQLRARAWEAVDRDKYGKDEVQFGSRKSFSSGGKHRFWYLAENQGEKSIPALINTTERQKTNFTDTDILLFLE